MRFAKPAVVLAAATLLVSCGSEPAAPRPSSSTQAPSDHGAYASCLAENGVPTPPAGPGAPPGIAEETWAQAQQACAARAPGPAN